VAGAEAGAGAGAGAKLRWPKMRESTMS